MITKINRQDTIKKYPGLPLSEYNSKTEEYDSSVPDTFSDYVLTLPSKSFKGHVKLLGAEITDLTIRLGFEKLLFLGDAGIPWLHRDHDFKQAKEALQYLANHKIGKKFNGALQVDTAELPTFIKHLAWLVRTNAVLPYIHFIDPGQNVMGSICQYGNLHIYTINKKAVRHLKEFIGKSKFQDLRGGECYNNFSKIAAIKGRQTTV
jgi:hypothetical protein